MQGFNIGLIGLSHKTAPVEIRERFSPEKSDLKNYYLKFSGEGLREAVMLFTCNRAELYFVSDDADTALDRLKMFFARETGMSPEDMDKYLYVKKSFEAAAHLLSVASSLDSMVIGENEIAGQIKECFTEAVNCRATGPVLNKLFHLAFKTSKQVRTQTGISRNPLSVAYIAVELIRKIFHSLEEKKALLIGAGEMGALILKYLVKFGIGELTIANRSYHSAEKIAEDHGLDAKIILLDDIEDAAVGVDVIVSSISAPHFMISLEMAHSLAEKRQHADIFMIDIAVPRNIDPAAGLIDSVRLYNIDDLEGIANSNLETRMSEIDLAREIIESNLEDFRNWFSELEAAPTISSLQNSFDEIRRAELELFRSKRLKHLSDEDFAEVEELSRRIMTKTLHNPIIKLKKHHREGTPEPERLKKKTRFVEDLFTR